MALVLLRWIPTIILMRRPQREGRKIDKRLRPNTKRSSKFVDETLKSYVEQTELSTPSTVPQTNFCGRNATVIAKMTELLKEKTISVSQGFRKNEEDSEFKNDWKYVTICNQKLMLILT